MQYHNIWIRNSEDGNMTLVMSLDLVDNHGQEPLGNMLGGGMTGEQDDWIWQKHQWLDNGGKESNAIDKNIVNFCKNKNTKVVIVDEEEEQQPEPVNPDLPVANFESNSISILLNDDGDGTFTEASESPIDVGIQPISITTGFLDNDSMLDLAVTNQGSGDVTVFLGDVDGTFTRNDVGVGIGPSSVAVGFIDNDSNLDAAVANIFGFHVSVLLGNGDGTFTRNDVGVGIGPSSVAVGFIDNDSNLDAVVANRGDDDISVLLGNGDGTFTRNDVGVGNGPSSVAVGDFN